MDESQVETPKDNVTPIVDVATPIEVDQTTQGLIAKDNSQLMRIITIMMKGQAFPKTLDTKEKVIACWNVAAALKVPPAVAIQNMAVINGSVNIWGQLPKALAEATGQLEDFKLFLIDNDQNEICFGNKNLKAEVWAAVCQIKRKNRSFNEYVFSVDDAERAGLLRKPGPWKDYRKIMLARRAMAQAIKFDFPDAVMGVEIAEYTHNQAPDLKDVTPSEPAAVDEMRKQMEGQ